jgi:hypothetical protein
MKKTTLGALVAFVALLGIVMATREKQVNEGVPKLSLPPLQGEVTGIELTGPTPASLKFDSGAWTVNGKTADENLVKQVLDALKDFHATDFVTEKAEKQAELEVDDAKGVKMTLTTAQGPGWSLVFGKNAKTGGTYVRDAKSSAVFLTKSPLAMQVKKGTSGWRKKNITTATAADITKVKIMREGSELVLTKNGEHWQLGEDIVAQNPGKPPAFRFDEAAAGRVATSLAALNAQDFADEPVTPVATIEVTAKDKTLHMKVGAKNPAGLVPFSVEGDAQTYLLPGWTGDQLLKKVDDFRDTTLFSFDTTKVSKLAITAGGKSTVIAKDGASWKVVEPKALPNGFQFDPNMVTTQLNRLHNVRGTKVVTDVPEAKAGLGKPVAMVEVDLEGGGKQQLKLGSETATKELYAKGAADNLLYAVGPYEKSQLEQGLELFKKRPPPDMSQMRGLDQLPPDVRRQLEAQLRQQH